MLPKFPQFKKLELSDRADVEFFTKKYPPYSDFNFTSMWCWDIHGNTRLSELNGNLVVRFNDYLTGEPFYSFLGEGKAEETACALLEHSKKEGLEAKLKLVPEISIASLSADKFLVSEDRDNFDYILSVHSLKEYRGGKFEHKRNDVKRFIKRNHFMVEQLDFKSPDVQGAILREFQVWADQKKESGFKSEHEFLAFKRLFQISDNLNWVALGIRDHDKLAGFWITEQLGDGNAISHFEKADNKQYKGIYAYLKQQTAIVLLGKGVGLINLEQDLGISGLRVSKESYCPERFLKKFILTAVSI